MKNIESALHILEQLSNTSSMIAKKEILKANQDNNVLKRFFKYTLDADYVFNIKQKLLDTVQGKNEPDVIFATTGHHDNQNYIFECAEYFINNRKNIKNTLISFVTNMSPAEREMFFRMVLKDPKCGVSVATLNKIWPGIIDSGAKLCKAEPYSNKLIKKHIKFPAFAQIKADGARCLMIQRNLDEFKFISSSGKEYYGLESLKKNAESIFWDPDFRFVLDGELLVKDESGKILPRKEGNGILNKALKNTISKEESERIVFVVWDLILIEEYDEEIDDKFYMSYDHRWNLLNNCIKTKKNDGSIQPIGCVIVNSEEETLSEFRKATAQGEEGIILKNFDFQWKNKRVKDQVKYKLEMESTLKVVGWNYGNLGTKYEQQLGALVCESEDGLVKVDVGSGLDDTFRKEFAENPRIGWYIEVRSNGLIENTNNSYSLFLPRMIEERFDKTEADTYNTILHTQNSMLGLK